MGKILIIRGATYTPPTSGGDLASGDDNLGDNTGGASGDSASGDGTLTPATVDLGTPASGAFLSRTDGQPVDFSDSASDWAATGFIDIPTGAKALTGKMCSYAALSAAVCFYDSGKNFIGYVNDLAETVATVSDMSWGTMLAAVPDGAEYARLCYPIYDSVSNPPSDYLPPLTFTWLYT